MFDFNYFLIPICKFFIDKRYGLFQSHFISHIDAYESERNCLDLTKNEQYILSEMVNIVFIQENFYIEDNCYHYLNDKDNIDYSVFSDVKNSCTAQEIIQRIETKYEHFLFYSNKNEILALKEKLKEIANDEINQEEGDIQDFIDMEQEESRPKRIDHVEYLIITNKIQNNLKKTIEECFDEYNKAEYMMKKEQFESILLRFNQPMSNILPPYYSEDYAKSLLSVDAYEQWLEEKNKSTYIIKTQEIINIEAQRLIPNMSLKMFNKMIVFTKYKQQIWTRYQQLWK